jgi:hypothetical protein
VAIEHGYHAIGELLKRAIGHSKQVQRQPIPSEIRSRERSAVFSATN